MAGRLGSLGSLAPLSALTRPSSSTQSGPGGFSLDEEERKGTTSGVMGRGTTRPLGSLTTLGSTPASKTAAAGFDLTDDFDALLEGGAALQTAGKPKVPEKKKPVTKSYDSDEEDEYEKKDKKKSKKKDSKKDPVPEDKSKRPLPTRKLPSARPSTAPIGDFDDDSLFGIKKETSQTGTGAGARRTSLSKSQSVRESGTGGGDWDDDPTAEEHDRDRDRDREEGSSSRSGESTARKVSNAMSTRTDRRDAQASPTSFVSASPSPTNMPEPLPAATVTQDPPPPVTFGSRRPRATSGAGVTSTSAETPAPQAAPASQQQLHLPASDEPAAPAPRTFGSKRTAPVQAPPATAPPATEVPASAPAAVPRPAAATHAKPIPFPDDSEGLPLDDSAPFPSEKSPVGTGAATDVGSPDPFGGLDNPLENLGDQEGNLFSGFGAARPGSASGAAPVRARRALPTAGRRAGPGGPMENPPPATAGARLSGGMGTQHQQQQQQRHPVPPPNSASHSSNPTPSPTSFTSNANAAAAIQTASSGPAGPCTPATLQSWFTWLGISPRVPSDEPLLPIAHQANNARVPDHWKLVNGWWINTREYAPRDHPQVKHRRHPFLKHFLGKLDSKRLALKFNVEESEDEEGDEEIVASGDEGPSGGGGGGGSNPLDTSIVTGGANLMSPSTPSSRNALLDRSGEDWNPLSPLGAAISPKTRKIESAHPSGKIVGLPPPLQAQQSQSRPGSGGSSQGGGGSSHPQGLSINTAASTPSFGGSHGHGSGTGGSHPNTTPSPWYPGASAGVHPSPPSTAASITTIDHALPSRSTSLNRLESVPERNIHGRGESLDAAGGILTREALQRQAEADKQLAERLAQASLQSSITYAGGGTDGRIAELQAQLRLQSITIEELDKRKRSLAFELENADIHLSQLLSEARSRHEAQLLESERRFKSELESKRLEMSRLEQSYSSRIVELEDKLKSQELKRSAAIAQAVSDVENKSKETLEHSMKLAAQQSESQRLHFERELESQRLLHQNEINSIKQQQHDSVFLRSLVSQVESSASHLENLSKKVSMERSTSEKLTLEQLNVRDKLLKEKEAALEVSRQGTEELVKTFHKLQRENEEEKLRLREETLRLTVLQQDMKSESSLLRDQLLQERDTLRKERSIHTQQKDAWETKHKREQQELDLRKEMNERAHIQSLESLEEAQRERAEIMKQLDDEREEIRLEKRQLSQRRAALEQAEAALRSDETEFATHVRFFEQRLSELQLLGTKVKAQSSEIAEQYNRLAAERKLIEDAKAEARQLIEAGQKAREETLKLEEQRQIDKKEYERAKVKLLAAQKQLMLDQDFMAREVAVTKSIAGFQASLPQHLQAPTPRKSYPFAAERDLDPLGQSFGPTGAGGFDLSAYGLTGGGAAVPPSPHTSALNHSFAFAPHQPISSQPYDPNQITAALASLGSHTENLKHFLAEEKILTPTEY